MKTIEKNSIFPSLLTVLFIGLKLLDKITWSWWWVLSPIWIPAVILGVVFLLSAVIVAAYAALKK